MSSAHAQVRQCFRYGFVGCAFSAAEESRRPDAIFRDPYAEKLGRQRGGEKAEHLPKG